MLMKNNILNIGLIVVIVVAIGSAIWFSVPGLSKPKFCFDFVHDMQFGDRKVANPVNFGIGGPNGMMYYLPETPALQTALSKQGFTVDPYESTGGHVYAGAFFGPSTKSAVRAFQKKNGLDDTGEVNNATLDKLAALYSCPKIKITATTTIATTTKK